MIGNILVRILVIPFVYLLALLPTRLLYVKSTFFFYFVYYVIGYRKKVVLENLANSFPEKTREELRSISKKFYRHFCDILFETIKNAHISPGELKKRCVFTPAATEIFKDYERRKQTIVAVLGHCGNWEWNALSYSINFKQTLLGVYHPLSNATFDRFVYRWRTRFGAKIIPMKSFYSFLLSNKDKPFTVGLIADQSPPPESATWLKFLNQQTPVFNGPAKVAKKFNYPLVYVHVIIKHRGTYILDVKKISDNPAAEKEEELTEKHLRLLEENIIQQPHIWLWSHRRWKHKPRT